jgi:hypothetical protein
MVVLELAMIMFVETHCFFQVDSTRQFEDPASGLALIHILQFSSVHFRHPDTTVTRNEFLVG